MRRKLSPSRSTVLRQYEQTALAEAADANGTGAPQFGQGACQRRWGAGGVPPVVGLSLKRQAPNGK
jgi:hypothetical protein